MLLACLPVSDVKAVMCSSMGEQEADADTPPQQKPAVAFNRVLQELRRQQQQGPGSMASNSGPNSQVCP